MQRTTIHKRPRTTHASHKKLKLSAFLPYRLSVLSNRVSALIADAYTQRFSLRIPEWRVIAVIGEDPGLTATQVAQRTAMDKVAVTRAVQALVAKGYLRREASQSDGRVTHLVLTRPGREVYAEIAPVAIGYENDILEALNATERRQLDRIVTKLGARLDTLESV